MHLRVFTAFSGYDSQCMALDRLQERDFFFSYDIVCWSEIEENAIRAHDALYPQYADRNFGDISKIDWDEVPDFDLFTYSSPCQDFSAAGRQAGGKEGSGTRSSLLWECRRAIIAKKPKYLVMENVAALVSSKFVRLFNKWQRELESYGYRNYAKVLNAKDYGVAQNRERIFMVSILDENARYEFPKPMRLTKCLRDYLETEVAERYYLSEERLAGVLLSTEKEAEKGNGFAFKPTDGSGIANTIQTNFNRKTDNYIIEGVQIVGNLQPDNLWGGGIRQQNQVIGTRGLSPAITAEHARHEFKIADGIRIRKLTEREAFRLMDVSETDIDKIQAAKISRSKQIKLAGNSIVVSVLVHIFDKMFLDTTITEPTLF